MRIDEFIETSMINEINQIKNTYPYWAFSLISMGIEFLGRILNRRSDKDDNSSKYDFRYAIHNLDALKEYRDYTCKPHINAKGKPLYDNAIKPLDPSDCKKDLYSHLRCGFAHQLRMGTGILLDNSNKKHFETNSLQLGVHAFFNDFKNACEEIIKKLKTDHSLASEKSDFIKVITVGNTSLSGRF